MRTSTFLFLLLFSILSCTDKSESIEEVSNYEQLKNIDLPQKPNILWITCEDQMPTLACFGDPVAVTPSLDKLAGEGVRFTNTFSTAGVCAPSRATLITGMYQNSIGTHHMRTLGSPERIRRP